jgi:predicted regulator of Ras-like GTPase activity (Roadblock/LC7/MglB family)
LFQEILQKAVEEVPGAAGAIFADWEGESVEYVSKGQEEDLKLLGAHQGIILNLAREVAANCTQGGIKGMLVSSEVGRIVVQPVKEGYYIVMLLSPYGNAGIAFKMLREAVELFRQEI